jgi:membrane-bound lytic murein transglycosylase D
VDLRRINQIPPRMIVRSGSTLLVHRNDKLNADVPVHLADNGQLLLQPEQRLRRVTVKARKGDNLASLARRHGVSAVDAARWNQLAVNSALKVGQTLTLHVPERATAKTAARTTAKASPRKPAAKAKPAARAKKKR